MCTVDSDVMPREEGVIWIIFNWWARSKDFFLVPVQNNWVPHGSFVTTQLIWRQTPKLCITVYWNKNSSSRHESRINIDQFPKQVPKFLGGSGGMLPWEIFLILTPLSPLFWLSESFRQDIASSILLRWSIFTIHFPDFNWESFLFKTYLLWKIWLISIKQRKPVWIRTCLFNNSHENSHRNHTNRIFYRIFFCISGDFYASGMPDAE